MGIFNEFNKKEKPVFTGSRFGFGLSGTGSASAAGDDPDVIASGGFVSDFTESGTHYRAHIFVDRGTTDFVVHSAPATATMDYLVVAGGGGGSRYGAGGAGGLRSTVDQTGGGGSLESLLQHTLLQLVKVEEELGVKEPLMRSAQMVQIHRLRDQLSQQSPQQVVVEEEQTLIQEMVNQVVLVAVDLMGDIQMVLVQQIKDMLGAKETHLDLHG